MDDKIHESLRKLGEDWGKFPSSLPHCFWSAAGSTLQWAFQLSSVKLSNSLSCFILHLHAPFLPLHQTVFGDLWILQTSWPCGHRQQKVLWWTRFEHTKATWVIFETLRLLRDYRRIIRVLCTPFPHTPHIPCTVILLQHQEAEWFCILTITGVLGKYTEA